MLVQQSPISRAERKLYDEAWGTDHYGDYAPGEEFLPAFIDMARPPSWSRVLDAGTGSGKGAAALTAAGFRVTTADITQSGMIPETRKFPFVETTLWSDLRRFPELSKIDYAYCTDVLEHIPPQFTMLTISRLLEVARKGAFLSISLVPDQFGVWVGQPLHQTVYPFEWWRESIKELGTLVESRDLIATGLYLVAR